ncbi:MAG TPA: NUDIX hydrolase [Candidatus Dormibacteraeota bacterium]|nr:NUDIX hydrolase [Candidatus Dormibacteraeota bacterium]
MSEIFRGRIITLRQDEVTLPGGGRVTLEIVHHPGAAAIVAIDGDGTVALIRQFRHAAGGFIWEVPAGTLGHGESPAACARRELQEETGLVAAQWTALGSVLTTPGFCDERIHLFLARDLRETTAALEDDEVLSVSRVPLARALAMAASGEIDDAKSIAALYRAQAALA